MYCDGCTCVNFKNMYTNLRGSKCAQPHSRPLNTSRLDYKWGRQSLGQRWPGSVVMRCIAIVLCLATLSSVCFASCPYMGAPETDEAASSGCPFATLTERKDPNSTEVHTISSHMEAQPDKGQMTVQGCECESSCGASISDGFNCDWCLTKDNCGTRGFSGSYGLPSPALLS